VSVERAREALGAFLTEGAHAPFEGAHPVAALEGIGRDEALGALQGTGPLTFVKLGELIASVDSSTGQVTYFSRMKPLMWVETNASDGTKRAVAERAAEIARRARFTLDEDVARARSFLEARYPGGKTRVFEVEKKERQDHDSLVEDELVFVERPRKGVAACWPNRVEISVDPERGAITTWVAGDVRVESSEAPKISAEVARRAVIAAIGGKVKPESRAWLEKGARVVLVAVLGTDGKPRTTWLVAGSFGVDATTGEVHGLRGASREGR
jgi:hypothetical protein